MFSKKKKKIMLTKLSAISIYFISNFWKYKYL